MLVAPPSSVAPQRVQAAATTPYLIGDPTPEEQLYVEMINRARANPVAESLLFYNTTDPAILSAYAPVDAQGNPLREPVNLELMLTEFALLPPVPPLALNERLSQAARRHTADMFDNVFQEHQGTDGTFVADRVTATGYPWSRVGENIYSYSRSVFYGHAGFEVDWGPGPGGMQTGRGHRTSIHNGNYREIGMGVTPGTNEKPGADPVGPQLVTQVFGTLQNDTPLITGVVYYDLNGSSFYDIGEGIGGVKVEASGASQHAVSARSGGYSLPVPGNGTYTLTFSGGGFAPQNRTVTILSSQNVKEDFTPAYMPPAVTGDTTPAVDQANSYSFAAVPGASEHEWRSFQKSIPQSEGAESGASRVTIIQSAGYNVIQSDLKASGSFAFHLAHPGNPRAQTITFNQSFLIGPGAALAFQSRLGWAADDQHAQVQVSDDGITWQVLYEQAGSGGSGENSFSQRSVDLSAYGGKTLRVRFVYDWQSGTYYDQTLPEVGWLIDDITFTGMEQISNEQTAATTSGSFQFQPSTLGEYGLQVRAKTGHEFLPWGPVYDVEAVEGTAQAEFRIGSIQRVGSDLHLQLEVTTGTLLATEVVVEATNSLNDGWTASSASVNTSLLVVIPNPGGPGRFFRIRKN